MDGLSREDEQWKKRAGNIGIVSQLGGIVRADLYYDNAARVLWEFFPWTPLVLDMKKAKTLKLMRNQRNPIVCISKTNMMMNGDRDDGARPLWMGNRSAILISFRFHKPIKIFKIK